MLPVVLIGGVIALLFFASSKSYATPTSGGAHPSPLPGGGGFGGAPGSRGVNLPGLDPIVFHTAPPAPNVHPGTLNVPGGGVTPVSPPLVNPNPPAPPTSQTVPATVTTHDTGETGRLAIRSQPNIPFLDPLSNVVGWAEHGATLLITGSPIGDISGDPNLTSGWYPVLQPETGIQGFSAAAFLTIQLSII